MSEGKYELVAHLINEIEMYMRDDDFQRDFFDSVHDQFDNGKPLSQKQIDALHKIYERVTE